MTVNLHLIDRLIRFGLGAVAIWLALTGSAWFLLAAAIMLITGAFNFCPLYKALGISTATKDTTHAE